jgi:hypothetical protein
MSGGFAGSRQRAHVVAGFITAVVPLTTGSALHAQTVPQTDIAPLRVYIYPQTLQFEPQSTGTRDGDLTTAPILKYEAKTDASDVAQPTNGALQGFAAPVSNWQRDNVVDTKLNFSLLQDIVQLSIRQASSAYAADPSYLRLLAQQKKAVPFNYTEGSAGLARLDVKVFQSDLIGVTAFASHSDVDPFYKSLASEKAKDEFAVANQSSDVGGTKLRFGPLSLVMSYTTSTPLSDGSIGYTANSSLGAGGATHGQDQTLSLDMRDIRTRTGDLLPESLWAFAPSSVYAGTFVKEIDYITAPGIPAQLTGASTGASWQWNGGTANIGYWNYYLNSHQVGEASYDSSGHGYNANIGGYNGLIAIYAGISYQLMNDLAPLSTSLSSGYNAYSSLTYKPAGFPDVVLEGTYGRYGYNSAIYGINGTSNYWSATLGFEFSKFLWSPTETKQLATTADGKNNGPVSLKLFYRYSNETDYGFTGANATPGDSHLFGMMFRTKLNLGMD